MGKIGYGYGSEWHLLRYLGRHRNLFNQMILEKIAIDGSIEWLDFNFKKNPKKLDCDAEWKGFDFLDYNKYKKVFTKWKMFWPQTGNKPNWDLVGWLHNNLKKELLLLEAKAHIDELKNDCRAKTKGLAKIKEAMAKTKRFLGVEEKCDWLHGYYQYANRICLLYFLNKSGLSARLVLIYFLGDKIEGKICPNNEKEWEKALQQQDSCLGINKNHSLKERIHKLFLPIHKYRC